MKAWKLKLVLLGLSAAVFAGGIGQCLGDFIGDTIILRGID